MNTNLHRSDPVLFDSLMREGGEAVGRGVKARKHYWRGKGISPSRGSRHLNGDPHSPPTRYLVELMDAGVNCLPLALQGVQFSIQRQVEPLTPSEIERELRELDEAEHELDADEDRKLLRAVLNPTADQLEASAKADEQLAELMVRRAALRRRLARLKRKGMA